MNVSGETVEGDNSESSRDVIAGCLIYGKRLKPKEKTAGKSKETGIVKASNRRNIDRKAGPLVEHDPLSSLKYCKG
jgi:hypothetical protein